MEISSQIFYNIKYKISDIEIIGRVVDIHRVSL